MKVYAIIPSGGLGKRAGSPLPKQYIRFEGKELIAYTLEVFQKCCLIDSIIVAARKEFFPILNELKSRYSISKLESIIEGGVERQHSVANALKLIPRESDNIIAVHDAVRPLADSDIIEATIRSAIAHGSGVAAIKAKDTLVKGEAEIEEYVDREKIFYVQTPQVFRQELLLEAFEKAERDGFVGTDESMLVKRAGYAINLVQGSEMNFKITTDADIKMFEMIIKGLKG